MKTFGWLKYFKELSRTRLKWFSNTQPFPECTSLITFFEHSKWSNIRVSPHKALRILGILRILEILSDTHPLHPAPLTRLHSQSDAPLYSTDNPPTLTIETSIYLIRIAKGPQEGGWGRGVSQRQAYLFRVGNSVTGGEEEGDWAAQCCPQAFHSKWTERAPSHPENLVFVRANISSKIAQWDMSADHWILPPKIFQYQNKSFNIAWPLMPIWKQDVLHVILIYSFNQVHTIGFIYGK